jgi:cysteinyl-tRNA synthetase
MAQRESFTAKDLSNAAAFLADVENWLGILGSGDDRSDPSDSDFAKKVEQLLGERKTARSNRDFARADAIRDELTALGVEVMDSVDGVKWRKKLTA